MYRILLSLLVCVTLGNLAPREASAESASSSTQITLFADGHPVTGRSGSVLSVAAIGNCLAASFRGSDGEQRLDIFKLTEEVAELVDTRSYGNLLEDQSDLIPDANLKAPRDLRIVSGSLIWWSYFKL